jgi:N-acyl-D-aspartate/D-glutamate deacylase
MPSRRTFLAAAAGAVAWLRSPPALRLPWRREFDLVLRRGLVYSGLPAPPVESDIAIQGGRIAAVGRDLDPGVEEIDLGGVAVAPGFVDIHSHGDGTLVDDPLVESVIRQGVTTIVVGQDGSSREIGRFLALVDDLQPACNVATMVGLGSVRAAVIGDVDRAPTPEELDRMVLLVEQGLAEGACGVSSGLEYVPGGFAGHEELVALANPAGVRGLCYATHLRNEDDRLLPAIDEAVAVARDAGCGLQISHLKAQGPRNWGKMQDALDRIAAARALGVDAWFDLYPYTAYQTGLSSLFPLWSREGGTTAFLARLADPSTAAWIRRETLEKVELIGGWNNVLISAVAEPADRVIQGRRLGELAAERSADPYDEAVTLLRRSRGSVTMVGFAMSEANVDLGLAHPLAMVCSDGGAFAVAGPARRGHPHPRSFGAFPRVLGRYVRERRALSLEDAIHKMTARPALRARLADRGRLAPGAAADLVAFDPATVSDQATYENPFQYPDGILLVVVNGLIVLQDGQRTAARPGRALRPT